MLERQCFFGKTSFVSGKKQLLKVQALSLVDYINELLRFEIVNAFLECRHVCRAIKIATIRFDKHERWNFSAVSNVGERYNQRTIADDGSAIVFQSLKEGWYAVVITAFAEPLIEVYSQLVKVSPERQQRHIHYMLPQ